MNTDTLTPAAVAALSDEELNKACAERVMGWEYIAQGCGWYARKGDGYAYQCAAFSPATSLADAAMCTEAMLAKGFGLLLTSPGATYRGDITSAWNVVLYRRQDVARVEVFAVSEPRARAEAALLACGKEEG
jgi:hypothetical protein